MGRPPACVFIVRHGNRLDAADKAWHVSSATPYDTPLTYGGWQQARALGARIASLIREKVREDEAVATQDPGQKHRKYRVVLHSSPFLRCVQTSIGISAGLAKDPKPFGPSAIEDGSNAPDNDTPSARSRPMAMKHINDSASRAARAAKTPTIQKTILRLDAFLGEWASNTYFETITPPPESVIMLASAKADLLRQENYHNYPTFNADPSVHGQLWSAGARTSPVNASWGLSGLESMTAIGRAGPGSGSLGSSNAPFAHDPVAEPAAPGGYIAPSPNYAVSANTPIPMGYVAHARDACVDIDYQWDSTRPPLDWGKGGSFPEEWVHMHKRLRNGIQKLLDWYASAGCPTEMVTKTAARCVTEVSDKSLECAVGDLKEVETEAIVVLVSHGAGCNALIGAMSNRAALMDIGIASLTMAVRRPEMEGASVHEDECGDANAARSVLMHELYEFKFTASTDHLRPSNSQTPASSFLRQSRSSSLVNGPTFTGANGCYSNSMSPTINGLSFTGNSGLRSVTGPGSLLGRDESLSLRTASRLSNDLAGGITVGSGVTSFMNSTPTDLSRATKGLWSPMAEGKGVGAEDDEDDGMLPDFGGFDKPASSTENKSEDLSSQLDFISSASSDLCVTPITPVNGCEGETTPPQTVSASLGYYGAEKRQKCANPLGSPLGLH